jgi:hypothetical protein
MWHRPFKSKKKLPERRYLIGNHEDRITRAIELSPELEGSIGLDDLKLEDYWHDVTYYEGKTPGICIVDGIAYSHYFVSGVSGNPSWGEHHAYSIIKKNGMSSTQGHSHLFDFAYRTNLDGRKTLGCIAGVYQDYDAVWAGQANRLWWRGVIIKRGVEQGGYDLQVISLEELKKTYARLI